MSVMILDGGLGQELVTRYLGEKTGLWGAQVMIDAPELVQQVHTDYFKSGAQIATSNTYVLHRNRLVPFDMGPGHVARLVEQFRGNFV
ncbi:MAG: S-methylmethionine-dependent homocysteine/selenocysteine methylase [Saprospiraceae bacterium]|jgi:S-methylmethionine-dependent homocysteine/selenocysteine methylase